MSDTLSPTITAPRIHTTPTASTGVASTLEVLATGDVIELELDGETISALVLLATDDALILDTCDGATPLVVRRDELGPHRRFDPEA